MAMATVEVGDFFVLGGKDLGWMFIRRGKGVRSSARRAGNFRSGLVGLGVAAVSAEELEGDFLLGICVHGTEG